jgi:outer membrane protein assembly factor BamC
MKIKTKSLVIVAVLVNLPACSTIKSLFPDKEKDYQFTTEIPPLILPTDLMGDSIAGVPVAPAAEKVDAAVTAPVAEVGDAAAAARPPAATPTETIPAIDRKLIQVELVDGDQGAKQLHIGAPLSTAWRIVGKALSRKSVEVTSHNQDEGMFRVQYDPNKQETEDGSFWDEMTFVFTGFKVTEQELIVKLVESNQQTFVSLMDKDQKPVADAGSLSLLKLLHDTIKSDLAK